MMKRIKRVIFAFNQSNLNKNLKTTEKEISNWKKEKNSLIKHHYVIASNSKEEKTMNLYEKYL